MSHILHVHRAMLLLFSSLTFLFQKQQCKHICTLGSRSQWVFVAQFAMPPSSETLHTHAHTHTPLNIC